MHYKEGHDQTMSLRGRILCLIASVALMAVGVILSESEPSSLFRYGGSILAALGGALLSLSLSEINQLDQAKRMLAPHIEPVCHQFLADIKQLRQTVKDFRDKAISDETATELIAAHTSALEEALRNLSAYSGVEIDRERFRKRREQTRFDEGPESTAFLNQTSHTMREDSARIRERVACPYCREEVDVLLGPTVGDSATSVCPSCKQRFHVHRDRHGEPFTKAWGSGQGPKFEFWCPSCAKFLFSFTGQPEARYCLECFALVEPVPGEAGGKILRYASPPTPASVVGDSDGRYILECPECKTRGRAFVIYKNWVYANCPSCHKLVRAQVPGQVQL